VLGTSDKCPICPTVSSAKYAGPFRCGVQDLLHMRLLGLLRLQHPTSVTVLRRREKRSKKKELTMSDIVEFQASADEMSQTALKSVVTFLESLLLSREDARIRCTWKRTENQTCYSNKITSKQYNVPLGYDYCQIQCFRLLTMAFWGYEKCKM
jgi:hypothetical protein